MKKSKAIVLLLVLALAAGIILIIHQSRVPPPKKQPQPKPVSTPSTAIAQAADKPTPEQIKFVNELLLPIVNEARQSYPIHSIRKKLDKLIGRFETGQISLQMMAVESDQSAIAAAVKTENGQLQLFVVVPAAMRLWVDIRADRELFKDNIVGFYLHEEFHLIVEGGHKAGEQSPSEMAESESKAWWYTIEEVYLPMIRANRLRMINESLHDGLEAYREANGDRHHPAWVEFSKQATGLYD